ncbi:MAG TPA: YqaE/Pmp3 family membrane protein [Bacteroidia bacterium]|nr:YqaE/Pmp3 family membrane protein [Bacteroidia bacterium]
MKKLFSYSILAIAGIILFSANGNAQKLTITKRHYTKGFYVDFGSKKKTESKTIAAQTEKRTIATAESNTINTIPSASNDAPEQMTLVPVNNVSAKKGKAIKHFSVSNTVNKLANAVVNNNADAVNKVDSPDMTNDTKTGGHGGSIPVVILIILAIICPPVAVYLHDNQIAPHFWWVLILWLLGAGIGFGFNSLGYLFWLAAIIWAILICTGSAGNV